MSLRIAIAGKGGTGKTTLAALLCRSLLNRGVRPLLAVDADPNSCLAEKLGVRAERTIGDLREQLRRNPNAHPAGMSKTDWMERLINESVVESTGWDMVVMGRQEGPDCYCFINNLLRQCMAEISGPYRAVVIDNEAGLEHLSRRSNGEVDVLLVAAQPTIAGARTAVRIVGLVKSLELRVGACYLVLTQCNGEVDPALRDEFAQAGLERIAAIPSDAAVLDYERRRESMIKLPADAPAAVAVDGLVNTLLERRKP